MLTAFRKRFSRRRFFAYATGLFGTLLAACSSSEEEDPDQDADVLTPESVETPEASPTPSPTQPPTPTATVEPTPQPPPQARYWIAPAVAETSPELLRRITDTILATEGNLDPVEVERAEEADIAIRRADGSEEGITVHGEPLIPVAAVDQHCPGLTVEQVDELLNGAITSWVDVEGPDREVVPAIHPSARRYAGEIETEVTSREQLAQLAGTTAGLFALVPRSLASFHVQALYVDEIDSLRDELTPESWPWWEQLAVELESEPASASLRGLEEDIADLDSDPAAPRRTMLTAVGDVCLGRTIHTTMVRQDDWRAPYRLVTDELQRGDLTIGNLECAITGSFAPPEDPRTFSFMSFPAAVDGLAFAGFSAMSGANNHAMDFGVTGMRDTIAALAEYGIEHFGTGDDLAAAREPCLLEHEGTTFALLGYDSISMNFAGATVESGGVSPMIREYIVEDIQRARERADVVIPFFHWGVEYTLTPTEADRQIAHAAVDAGADLVLGGHPHWVQGMETYQGRPIFYSLSNFIFDQEWSFETKQGFILHLTFDGAELAGFRVVPVLIEDFHRPRIVEDEVRTTILDRFWESTRLIAGG